MATLQKEKAATTEFRKEAVRLLARLIGQRFMFPSLATGVGELKAAFQAFEERIADVDPPDREALVLLEALSDQTRAVAERETGKDLGVKVAEAYREIVALRATL